MGNDVKRVVLYHDGQIAQAKAYAAYWIGMATSGAAARRKITGGDGHILTAEELIDEAMATALSHTERIGKLVDSRDKFLREERYDIDSGNKN